MTDERLRESERRWADTGGVAEEAAFLGARHRTGELARDRLKVAAFSGSDREAARAVLGPRRPPLPTT